MSLKDVKGIGEITSTKLINAGISSVDHLSVMRPDELKALLGFNTKQAKETIQSALDLAYREVRIYTGDEYEQYLDDTIRYIPTGSKTFDEYLGGGWPTISTNGLYGLQATGKTQLINTAIASCIDAGMHVLTIETESNTVHVPRIRDIAKSRGYNYDGALHHIYPSRNVGTVFGQFRGYLYLKTEAEKNGYDVGLITVDSFNAKFRRAYSGREMYPERAQEFGRHIDFLEEMAKQFNACVMLTFQCGVTPDPSGALKDKMKYHGEFYPVGGTLVAHNINTWLSLQQKSGGEKSDKIYHASITDHNFLPMSTFDFLIDEYGVRDVG